MDSTHLCVIADGFHTPLQDLHEPAPLPGETSEGCSEGEEEATSIPSSQVPQCDPLVICG